MILFQWLAGGLMSLLIVAELVMQARRMTRRRVSLVRLAVWISALVFIIRPELTQRIASELSIGRGADAVFYATTIAFVLSFFYLLHVVERQREQLTQLVHEIGIREPYWTPNGADGAPESEEV
jgi:hypothetical protein